MTVQTNTATAAPPRWQALVAKYQNPDLRLSLWQAGSTFALYALAWGALAWSLSYGYWLTLLLVLPASGLLMRIFIIQHDCGHGSFFKSQKANDWLGFICGVVSFTPYYHWRHSHAKHHAGSGDLDRRGFGDVWTLTVDEYLKLDWWGRLKYRMYRQPIFMLFIGGPLLFLFYHRFAYPDFPRRERMSVLWTNVGMAAVALVIGLAIGFDGYLKIQLPITLFSSAVGVWLFYVQHQFEDTYWEHHQDWAYELAALKGSSFFRLPRLLQWFTGNIGFHHIHHLSPRIPNYRLEACHTENAYLQEVNMITLWTSLRCLSYRLWDEASGRMIGFGDLKQIERQRRLTELPQAGD